MRLIILLSLTCLFGCKSFLTPVLLTETRQGEKLTTEEIKETDSRKVVPVGEKPRDVVSRTTFSHAGGNVGSVIVTKHKWNPLDTPKVSYNCINCHVQTPQELGVNTAQPKEPWWKWPAIIGGFIVFLALAYFARPFMAVFTTLLMRFRK